jgi:glycine dehydrogenase subunit 2
MTKLIFEKSVSGRRGIKLPGIEEKIKNLKIRIPDKYKRKNTLELPEVSELDVVRHYTELSKKNYSVDSNFYPLGSCTMKYNPKINEKIASLEGFAELHPLLPQLRGGGILTQGALQVIYEMDRMLCELTGMSAFTMQPLAGAHGELTGIMLVAAYHRDRGNKKTKVIIPDSAHGTNPASAAIAGYEVVSIPTGDDGCMNMEAFEKELDDNTAALMLTCPNTLGIFNKNINKVAEMAHSKDALLYYDGANFNALLGKCRPGDLGFDVVHLNLHKTFSTPHGGGGPGAGPVGVNEKLKPYLPVSIVVNRPDGTYALKYDLEKSIGYIAPFYGNFSIILRAYAYILMLGNEGLCRVSENAVLNANYIMHKLKKYYKLTYERTCMHECVLSASNLEDKGVHAIDIAKGLLDLGFHAPTVYFPLIVKEAIMIEPTETESKGEIDKFIKAMIYLSELAQKNPEAFKKMPLTTPVSRLDEVKAAREMKLRV